MKYISAEKKNNEHRVYNDRNNNLAYCLCTSNIDSQSIEYEATLLRYLKKRFSKLQGAKKDNHYGI